MFTGIIEEKGRILSVDQDRTNKVFWIESMLATALKIDESVNHNGVCLTVEEISGSAHRVSAVKETLSKTNLSNWLAGDTINLERSMQADGRIHGHIVQGHVDGTGVCLMRTEQAGSWEYTFSFDPEYASLVVEKGSICVNGVSLTAFNTGIDNFRVAIIPFTYEHTNFSSIKTGTVVNIEFDIMGKYIQRYLDLRQGEREDQFSSSL
ncbi:MAG: riboflavin synthase [Ginsengibacter sp.]